MRRCAACENWTRTPSRLIDQGIAFPVPSRRRQCFSHEVAAITHPVVAGGANADLNAYLSRHAPPKRPGVETQ
ncbi:MAG: hypothetical protein WDO73_26450 [Ignavibacteriota bacterium]